MRASEGDRIVVLEDTDGDGRADRRTFVQEPTLVAPLGIAVLGNKVIVSNAPDLIVYTDVDRRPAASIPPSTNAKCCYGFDGRNHDHALHSVTFGPDGRWYFSQGNAGRVVHRSRRQHLPRRQSRTTRCRMAALSRCSALAASLRGREERRRACVRGRVSRRACSPTARTSEILGFNFRNSYEQTVTSFGDIFHNDNDDPPACRTTWLMEYGNLGFFSRDGKRYWQADRRPGQSIPIAEWRQEDPGVIPAGDVYGGGAPTGIVFNENGALGSAWDGTFLAADAGRNEVFAYKPARQGGGFALDRKIFLTSNVNNSTPGLTSSVATTRPKAPWKRSSGRRTSPLGRMARCMSVTGLMRASAGTRIWTTRCRAPSTGLLRRASCRRCRPSTPRPSTV